MEIKLDVSEIFDSNIDFEMIMFQVFTARNDIKNVNLWIQKAEMLSEQFFSFKMMIGILREAEEIIREIIEKYEDEIRTFYNWKEIKIKLDKFMDLNEGLSKESFSYKVLSGVRNQIFHYKKIQELQEIYPNMSERNLTFELGKTSAETKYDFVDSVMCEYISEKLKLAGKKGDIGKFVEIITPYSVCVFELLEGFIEGYLEKYTNLLDNDFYGENLQRKNKYV